jgi:hypothetical protein
VHAEILASATGRRTIADEAAEISARIIAGDEAQSRLKAAWSKAVS